jgi:Flp pilus assembly protein TadD
MPRHDRSAGAPPRALTRAQCWIALAVLVALVVVVFSPALSGGFVWDDHLNVDENVHVQSLSLENVRWAFAGAHGGHYQPLTWISYMLDHAIGGLEPWTYHVTNLVWHALDVVLFALLAWQLLRAASRNGSLPEVPRALGVGALVAAAVFGLHPLRVESVAWVTERRDVLCAAFFLLSILAYVRAVDVPEDGRVRIGWYGLALVCFALSLLGKALGMALPIVLLVIDAVPLRRHESRGWGRLSLEKLPFLALAVASGVVALYAQREAGALVEVTSHAWPSRIAQACYGIAFYPYSMLLATGWYPLHGRPEFLDPWERAYVLSALAILAITIAAFAVRRRYPAWLAAWVAYVALVAPVSGIAQSGIQLVADRYSYLSCLSFALLAGFGVCTWWTRTRPGTAGRIACVTVTLVVLAYWSVRSWQQTRVWHDGASLWTRVIELQPSALAYNNLGDAANRRDDRPAALDAFASALALQPSYEYARANLVEGLIADDPRVPHETVAKSANALRRSLDVLHLDDAKSWFALGLARGTLEDLARAREAFERAAELAPDFAPTWSKLGLLRYLHQDRPGAIAAYQKAVALDAQNFEAWMGLGIASIEAGDAAGGVDAFTRASEIEPKNPMAWTGLGTSLWMRGDAEAAGKALERALEIDPENARAALTLEQVRAGKQ